MIYAQGVAHNPFTSNYPAVTWNSKHADATEASSKVVLRKRYSANRHRNKQFRNRFQDPFNFGNTFFAEEPIPISEVRPIQAQFVTESALISRETIAGMINTQLKEQRLLVRQSHPNDSSVGEDPPEEIFSAKIVFTPASHTGLNSQIILDVSQALTKENNILSTPILSFRSMIPDSSEVFRIVQFGSIRDLQTVVSEGTASFEDCDTHGRSLLNVGINLPVQPF